VREENTCCRSELRAASTDERTDGGQFSSEVASAEDAKVHELIVTQACRHGTARHDTTLRGSTSWAHEVRQTVGHRPTDPCTLTARTHCSEEGGAADEGGLGVSAVQVTQQGGGAARTQRQGPTRAACDNTRDSAFTCRWNHRR
jgi:hypothetical protein